MATKTISIEIDVYDRLKSLKASPSESFSQVLRRELSGPHGLRATELLHRAKQPGGFLGLSETDLDLIEAVHNDQPEWRDKWTS